MGREELEGILRGYLPVFRDLDSEGVPYCLVGGLAVLLHAYVNGYSQTRSTHDADIMFDDTYSNDDFARDYLRAFGTDGDASRALYEKLFGENEFKELSDPEQSLINTSFVGVNAGRVGGRTPDFDVVRQLNGFRLEDLDSTTLVFEGVPIRVASIPQLIEMKRRTSELLTSFPGSSPRAQDIIDISVLSSLAKEEGWLDEEARGKHDDGRSR